MNYSDSRRSFLAAGIGAAACALTPASAETEDFAALTLKKASQLLRAGPARQWSALAAISNKASTPVPRDHIVSFEQKVASLMQTATRIDLLCLDIGRRDVQAQSAHGTCLARQQLNVAI